MIRQILKFSKVAIVFLLSPQLYCQFPVIDNSEINNLEPTFQPSYSAEQDSIYFRELRNKIPPAIRFSNAIRATENSWKLNKELSKGIPIHIAVQNVFNVPRSAFTPTGNMMVQQQINTLKAFEVPFVNTYPQFGRFDMNDVLNFFGLGTDNTPEIRYTLEHSTDVEVVIYSVAATVVATIFQGPQTPGNYTLVWNCRDDKGKKMPSGDYIAEVRMGNFSYVRKAILIP